MRPVIEVSHLYCAATGLEPGEDGSTHHLVPRGPAAARRMVCTECGATEATLRANASVPPVANGRDAEGSPIWYSCPMCAHEVERRETPDDGPTDLFICGNCGWSYES